HPARRPPCVPRLRRCHFVRRVCLRRPHRSHVRLRVPHDVLRGADGDPIGILSHDAAGLRMTALRDRTTTALLWAVLLFLIPLAPVLGSAASVAATVVAIILVPFVVRRESITGLGRQPALVIFMIVFVALAVCFAMTARA